jgi:hypothetical protein
MKQKKGMIFTIVAILLVGVLIAGSVIVAKTTYKQKSSVAQSRVNTMNDFILSMQEDAKRNLMISSYRALISLQANISKSFPNNFSSVFQELMLNGTINGQTQEFMANATINDWVSRINYEANKLNIEIKIIPLSVRAYHISPWAIETELNATVNITDFNNLAFWYYNKSFTKSMDIVGFEDPLYTVKSRTYVPNIITRANSTNFVNLSNNDTSVLYTHLNNSYYIASEYAPSFLMRFEGNLSASPYGIESLINKVEFSSQGLPTYNRSIIDYEYFNDSYSKTDKCGFPAMPSWFRIDEAKLGTYNLTGKGSACP